MRQATLAAVPCPGDLASMRAAKRVTGSDARAVRRPAAAPRFAAARSLLQVRAGAGPSTIQRQFR
eukprot:3675659-Pyramimonas_sp.AAC.1